jgi:streptomycin 6-kinase
VTAIASNLSPEFIKTIRNTFGENGERWLESFPELLDEAARRWDLTDIRPVPDLSYNFVAFATETPSPLAPLPLGEGNVVLKLGVPHRELTSEIAALQHYAGRGTCRLLDAEAEKGMLLLERLKPGHMLSLLEDDERATRIAAQVMKNLWENHSKAAAPRSGGTVEVASAGFIQLTDWFDGFQRLRQRFDGGTGSLPTRLVETAEALSRDLLSENKDEVLLHGDFHHYNVLESQRGWLAIDPKGVVGPRGYEVGPFLINPIDRFLSEGNPRVRTERRIAILSEMLGMERERIRDWGICHAVLSAWWSNEGNDPVFEGYSIRCAEIFIKAQV